MTDQGLNRFQGMRVIESAYLEEDGEPYIVRRTWRQRLFSRPWRPWQTTYTVVPKVPFRGAIQLNKTTLVMHPDTVRLVRRMIPESNQ